MQEALEVLRTTPSTVELVVSRLPGDMSVTPPGAPPPPPARREPPPPLRILNPLPPLQIEPCGVSNFYQEILDSWISCIGESHAEFHNFPLLLNERLKLSYIVINENNKKFNILFLQDHSFSLSYKMNNECYYLPRIERHPSKRNTKFDQSSFTI